MQPNPELYRDRWQCYPSGNRHGLEPAPTVTLSAAPSSVASGTSSMLTWSATNATACTASGAWSGSKAVSGSQSTGALTGNATYTLTCTGTGGSAAQSATVSVKPPAPTVTLSVGPSAITSGSSAMLTWSSTNATSCVASGAWSGTKAVTGTQSTGALTANATYTLSCTGTGGSAAQSATVSVTQPVPTITLGASPSTVASGSSSALTWSTTNATACTASGSWSGAKALTGTQSTGALTANATYTLTCTGTGGSAAQSATVSVTQPVPTVSLAASPSTVASGGSSTLTWSATNATTCAASGGWSGNKAMSGSQSMGSLTTNTTYTLNCTGTGGSAAQSATVSVTQPVPTVTFSASPSTVASGGSSTLSWSATNATSCTASGAWSGAKATTGGSQSTGALTANQTYTLTCTGAGGSAAQSATVSVTTPAPAVTLTANPTTVNSGATSALSWSSTNATACTASGGWTGSESTAGSQTTAALTATTRFTLTCTGAGGSPHNPRPSRLARRHRPCRLPPVPAAVASGGTSTLTWTSTNATTCTASGGWAGSEPTAGSQSTAALAATTNFTMTCTGAGGSASQTASVTVNGAAALAITSPSTLTVATKGAVYSYTMAASGGTPPYTWSLVSDSGSSNTWNVSGAGVVSGTPSVIQADSLVIKVADNVGNTTQGTFSLTVNGGGGALAIPTHAALPNGTIGKAYSTTIQASGGTPPYTWALLSNSSDLLSSTPGSQATPANNAYSINSSTGVLSYSGNLAGAENDYFYIQVTDSANTVVQKEFAMNVSSSTNPLVIATPTNLGYIAKGTAYASGSPLATLSAVGNAASLTWSITAQTTTGATNNTWSIDSSTGAITGTASNVGINTLTVQATDGTNTATQYYNVGVYQYITGAPRPSYNPSSGTSPGTNIPVGPGFFVLNGELYEPNGNLFHQVGANSQYGDVNIISNPWMDALKVNSARNFINGLGGTVPTKAGEAGYANWYNTYWLDTHRTVDFVRAYDWSTTVVSGSTVLGTTSGGHAGMGTLLSEWVTQQPVYAPYMNKITITIANEYGPYSHWGAPFGQVYTAASAPITGLNGTTLTFSGTSPFNPTNAGGGIGYVYIKGATWSGANNDGLYAVSANGTNTLTGTFPPGYVSGGTVWAGAVGILRAAGYYCPLVIDSPGGQGYEDVVTYGSAIVQSDPLKNIIFSYHLYANQDNNNNQAQFESGILTPLNTLRTNSGAAIVVDEVGIYVKDQGGTGTANGGDQTAFPSGQQLQSFGKYGVSYFHWLLNSTSPQSDTDGGYIPGMRYNNSSNQSSATNAGYPSQITAFGKHTFLDPLRGSIANFPGYATSF